ncbi:MAG: bifunctional hydroxymethylpyrimidine kinase/phosphomethylpyrimidine kinase [Candidatus Krumholzibacteria bacterium]|nr:bifunctional hydroxymethylpyrimidine kinase/phosphomethylpyrimidine kinase [Candidatus Krumholzibacteria bacterium]
MKQALTIAGSDSGGGAGIQADIKSIEANGVFAASVVCAVTAQNTVEVRGAVEIPTDFIRSQLEAVFDDLVFSAVKTGMLSSAAIIETVAGFLAQTGVSNLVVDPVMTSKSGFRLLEDTATTSLSQNLLPLATVVTPNLHEAVLLAGIEIEDVSSMREAARKIHALGPRYVVVKGGHARFSMGTDVLFDGNSFREFKAEAIHPKSVHGTGCTFSAALTARLALGESVETALENAKTYVTRAILNQPDIGSGHSPGHHFYFVNPSSFRER